MGMDNGERIIEVAANAQSDEQRLAALADYGQKVSVLKQEANDLRATLQSLEEQIAQRKKDLRDELAVTISDLSTEVGQLMFQIESATADLQNLNVQINTRRKVRDDIDLNNSEREATLNIREAQINERDSASLDRERAAQNLKEGAEQGYVTYRKDVIALEKERADWVIETADILRKTQERALVLDAQEQQINDQVEENKKLLDLLVEANAQLVESRVSVAESEAKLKEVQAERELLLSDKANIKEGLAKIKDDTAQLQAWRDVLQKKENELKTWQANLAAAK